MHYKYGLYNYSHVCVRVLTRATERARDSEGEERRGEERDGGSEGGEAERDRGRKVVCLREIE